MRKLLFTIGIVLMIAALLVPGVAVASTPATASRDLPTTVTPGAEFDVDITASDYGMMGQVLETLPADFSYVSSSLDASQVQVTGNVVKFVLMGETSFTYTVTAATVEDTYTFSGTIKDENLIEYPIYGDTAIVVVNGGVPPPPDFAGTLAEDEIRYLTTIPAGATDLEITLTATVDIDLNLYDADTLVIGWHGEIDSSGPTTGTYEGDTFVKYSGWRGAEEYIIAVGPLSRAYDLKVYGYRAGGYTVKVSYTPGGPDDTPPEVTITAPNATVGTPTTIAVLATDPSGVWMVSFMVSSPYPEEWNSNSNGYEDIVEYVMSFDDAASLTFTPGWAGTYTVDAWAVDNQGNMTPEANPETTTFVVSE